MCRSTTIAKVHTIWMLIAASVLCNTGWAQQPTENKIDPKLQHAWDYYQDQEHRVRDKAVALFEDYLAANPDSPQKADIYYEIALLYLGNRNKAAGENMDSVAAKQYLMKAKKSYEGKYSSAAVSTWFTLVLMPGHTMEDRLEYYDWVSDLYHHPEAGKVWPYSSVRAVASGVRSPSEFTLNQREHIAVSFSQSLEAIVENSSSAIVAHARNDEELKQIVLRYPNDPISRKANERLSIRDEAWDRFLDADDAIRNAQFEEIHFSAVEEQNELTASAPIPEVAVKTPINDVSQTNRTSDVRLWIAGAVVGLLLATAIFLFGLKKFSLNR